MDNSRVRNGLYKLFSRGQAPVMVETQDDQMYRELDIRPAPFIHPLSPGMRLEARDETMVDNREVNEQMEIDSAVPQSPVNPSSTLNFQQLMLERKVAPKERVAFIPYSAEMERVSEELVDQIATLLALDDHPDSYRHWSSFLTCYSEGRFNMSFPPRPRRRSEDYDFLPAPISSGEAERLTASYSLWKLDEDKVIQENYVRDLILKSQVAFDVPWLSISWLDLDDEIFKLDVGFESKPVPRQASMAAHVVLSNEVMVILDTREDWRFSKNPFVLQRHIRFYAGAPMFAASGEVIGVLAVSGPRALKSFSAKQRRQLAELSALTVETFCHPSQPGTLRRTFVSANHSFMDGVTIHHPQNTVYVQSGSGRKNEAASRAAKTLGYVILREPIQRGLFDQTVRSTPPPSDDSDDNDDALRFNADFTTISKNIKRLSVSVTGDTTDANLMTPDSQHFPAPVVSRPYSVSDLTSIEHSARPSTPEESIHKTQSAPIITETGGDMSERLQRMDIWAEETFLPDSPTLGSSPGSFKMSHDPHTRDSRRTGVIHGIETFGARDNINITEPKNIYNVSRAPFSPAAISDAGLEIKLWAAKLSFDLMYIIGLVPSRPNLTDKELEAPGGMTTTVLISSSDSVPDINLSLHLDALRSPAYNMILEYGHQADFSIGMVTALKIFEPLVQGLCPGGFVFGAFRRNTPDTPTLLRPTESEFRNVIETGERLYRILSNESIRSPLAQYGSAAGPEKAFPANEAVEI